MLIIPFTAAEAPLDAAGGKGANPIRLTRAGFAVPRGFILSTAAYRAFVAAHGLTALIEAAVADAPAEGVAALEQASATIRAAFAAWPVPAETVAALCAEHIALGGGPMAVRSSATAEDLPNLSFAGQQDTVLNVIGMEQLLAAVVQCWSSLWTARAIGYRHRNGISHADVALAVVVQEMVPSDVAGVLFTANPLTGLRSESVIDATFGLGEALVSGQVEPDHFEVNSRSGEITARRLGVKQLATRSKNGGGTETISEPAAARQTLTADEIKQLAATGQQIQREYGTPQDVEWALAGGKLHILQARAITSLFPVPQMSLDPLVIWISFGAVQGLVGPLTPLGRDALASLFLGMGGAFDATLSRQQSDMLASAGERVWIKISDLIRNPIGHRLLGFLEYVEPSTARILRPLLADPRLGAGEGRLKMRTLRRVAHFALPVLARLVRNVLRPATARARFDTFLENYLSTAQVAPAIDRFGRLANIVTFVRGHVASAFQLILPRFVPLLGPSMAALGLLTRISGDGALALEVTRGLPRNVTTEMDLALWETAVALRAEAAVARLFAEVDAAALSARYLAGTLPAPAQATIARFLERYGMRGVGEIDLGQPRWREDPTPVMHTLQSYLQVDPALAPDVLFARGEQAARDAVEKLAAAARQQPGGWLKAKLVRAAARRIRLLMGARESPKFLAIRTMGIARRALLEVGAEFVAAGTLNRPDDLAFLLLSECVALSRQEPRDWKALVAARRATYARELGRRQVPRVLVSDGRAFYEGLGAESATGAGLRGSPVSPGVTEGIVRVVLDPRGTHLAPGEILVCPGTDPAWTPLFLVAGGLITEVGGMMTHGSVVAREVGIPAVVGVDRATERLHSGQRIRMDGTTGQITLLDL